MKPFNEMTLAELHEKLYACREHQRSLRQEREGLEHAIIGLGFQCDDIKDEIERRHGKPRLVVCNG